MVVVLTSRNHNAQTKEGFKKMNFVCQATIPRFVPNVLVLPQDTHGPGCSKQHPKNEIETFSCPGVSFVSCAHSLYKTRSDQKPYVTYVPKDSDIIDSMSCKKSHSFPIAPANLLVWLPCSVDQRGNLAELGPSVSWISKKAWKKHLDQKVRVAASA